jgi:hypothetical protein
MQKKALPEGSAYNLVANWLFYMDWRLVPGVTVMEFSI